MKKGNWFLAVAVASVTTAAILGTQGFIKQDNYITEAEDTVKQFTELTVDYINDDLPEQYVMVKYTQMANVMYKSRETRNLGILMEAGASTLVSNGDKTKLLSFMKKDFREAIAESPLDVSKLY